MKKNEDIYCEMVSLEKKKLLQKHTDFQKTFTKQEAERASLLKWAEEHFPELTPEQQVECEHIKALGLGVCSKCNWSSGCLKCDFSKAVRYYLKDKKIKPPKMKPEDYGL